MNTTRIIFPLLKLTQAIPYVVGPVNVVNPPLVLSVTEPTYDYVAGPPRQPGLITQNLLDLINLFAD